jgi:hypothetical protein
MGVETHEAEGEDLAELGDGFGGRQSICVQGIGSGDHVDN